jgi:hypothetical protein
MAETKIDGVAISLEYEDGLLVRVQLGEMVIREMILLLT